MKKALPLFLLSMFLIVGCSTDKEQNVVLEDESNIKEELLVIANNLESPWSIESLRTFFMYQKD